MHIGVAHHLGWAVVVAASGGGEVVDRRRIKLIDDDLPAAPIHHRGGAHPMHDDGDPLDDAALSELAASVRASATENVDRSFDALAADLEAPIESISLRDWPDDFPSDIAVLRRAPFESQADSVMYRQVMADAAAGRGWRVHRFDAKRVEADAIGLVGDADTLVAPRSNLGAPWNADHRVAFAATIVAARRPA
ncbi:MAG: hypothetical protein KDB21_14340 [Acidimicrobiales bacterium]|nr:hypothetical protein [Acidimicrobiales bacterium]MCB0996272.1 hypothetical protein [Acidimicrobiales bacterium]